MQYYRLKEAAPRQLLPHENVAPQSEVLVRRPHRAQGNSNRAPKGMATRFQFD
jgi:hypothetical protein